MSLIAFAILVHATSVEWGVFDAFVLLSLSAAGCSTPLFLISSALCYADLLTRTARYFGGDRLARDISLFYTCLWIVVGTVVVRVILANGHFRHHGWPSVLMNVALMGMMAVLYVWFIALIVRVRGVIE